jgi:hypothetical protein
MDMPVNERRLNIKFINEHLQKIQEIQEDNQMVTADKPLMSKPGIKTNNDSKPTYKSTVKSKR